MPEENCRYGGWGPAHDYDLVIDGLCGPGARLLDPHGAGAERARPLAQAGAAVRDGGADPDRDLRAAGERGVGAAPADLCGGLGAARVRAAWDVEPAGAVEKAARDRGASGVR